MTDLADLYQEIVIDHSRRPRNCGPMPQADRQAEGFNPLCGDQVKILLAMAGERIADIRFEGSGCAISTASASLLTEALRGRTEAEARALFADFHDLMTGDPGRAAELSDRLGKLAALGGVRDYPMRVKCATLAWHTLTAALDQRPQPVTTE